MPTVRFYRCRAGPRDCLVFGRPDLWAFYPFLPVVRYPLGEPVELGLLYDAVGASGTYGYSSTVFLLSIFDLPPSQTELLAHPRVSYDTLDELARDGWVV